MLVRTYTVAVAIALFGVISGCGHNIGDACNTNVDCAVDGTRFCDTAPHNGYCTVEGCDTDTCPIESVCISFYVAELNKPCTYDPCSSVGSCDPDERCVCDQSNDKQLVNMACQDTGIDGIACTTTAHCASENSERRWCMLKCSSDDDCRGSDYTCRTTGTLGAEPVPSLQYPYGTQAKFCVSAQP